MTRLNQDQFDLWKWLLWLLLGMSGLLFIGFFLTMSVWISWSIWSWFIEALPRLTTEHILAIGLILMLCVAFVILCCYKALQLTVFTLRKVKILPERKLPQITRADVARTIDDFVEDPYPFKDEVIEITERDFSYDALLTSVQAEFNQIYEEYVENGKDTGLGPYRVSLLQALSAKLRENATAS
jgi:hypothetical protein